ncbi:hypothetical protein H5V45_04015 [Nocardioides sp. KIGAM211]|uniref:Uncharacterized protein n=1 Tax=Nocardioides luti TaxID=2761101 RepID=A0A7X0RG95_9ACTN|nr:hypothetical protein [Nocardioides luti]MBB6626483.1 hypothetical protein [Nocardioides luti]
MTAKQAHPRPLPVVDVDQAFPAMTAGAPAAPVGVTALDQGPAVRTALRNVLGVRSREEDPKAFVDALTAAFRLVRVEGHVESQFVPRGYAVQADLGAVSGGQASLYRRATIARGEILRILDGLTALRSDADADDMESYRVIVRNGVQSLVDELGSPGGPRVAMVDSYFTGLVGTGPVVADTVGGQLGALRERFGLVDDNVNTIEEEGRRTSFWTLVDLVADLRDAWNRQRPAFSGAGGSGFLGTELILVSRLMEAASDQVEELEAVLDSVLISASERRTVLLDEETNLTLDGLLGWLAAFLADEGRRLAQDAGRDGIVAALAPTAVTLADTFRRYLADALVPPRPRGRGVPLRYLPTSCCQRWPAGMYAARVQIAVSGLCRLLTELARRAQRIGRWAGVVLIDITVSEVALHADDEDETRVANVEFRGLNLRPTYVPAFVPRGQQLRAGGCDLDSADPDDLVLPLDGTTTADEESISALFRFADIAPILGEAGIEITPQGAMLPASDAPVAVVNSETGRVVHAPAPVTWPRLYAADDPRRVDWHPDEVDPPDKVTKKDRKASRAAAERMRVLNAVLADLGRRAEQEAAEAEARRVTMDALLEQRLVTRLELDAEHTRLEAAHTKAPKDRKRPYATKMREVREERDRLEDEERLLTVSRDAADRESRAAAQWADSLRAATADTDDLERYLADHLAWVTAAHDEEGY